MKRRDLEMADITAIYDFHAKTAVGIINSTDRDLMPQMVAVQMDDEPGKIAKVMLLDPALINAMQRDDDTKDMMMWIVRKLLKVEGLADAVVHISESWVVSAADKNVQNILDGHERASDHPNRREALVVNVHTPERTYSGLCPIENDVGNRRAVFKPLDPHSFGIGRLIIEPENVVRH